MKISEINLKIIFDSRGKETLEAEVKSDKFSAIASVPSGKSTGKHEAFVLEPRKALGKIEEIKPQILAASATGGMEKQGDFDNFLISLDGTLNKSNIGGNLILALSLAWARLKAKSKNIELYKYIAENSNLKPKTQNLKPIFNVINGGAHATNKESRLDFQEFQVIPEVKDFGLAFGLGQEFYRKLKEFLEKKFGKENVLLGDEAGFSAPFKNNEEAFEVLAEVIAKYNYPLRIGLDAAASQFYHCAELRGTAAEQCGSNGHYLINGEKYSAEELKDYYFKLIDAYNILTIEDPFCEEDFDSFASLTADLGKLKTQINADRLVIADDLTTTNPERLKTAIKKKSGNAILIKPNQIGTLTETLKVVKTAYENDWQAVVSHRSGETLDDFIADLAVGIDAWGIKAGAPAKPERTAKYERILKIFESN